MLSKMEELGAKDDDRWNRVLENLDLLFAQVGEVRSNQQKLSAQFSISTQVMEQLLADQQSMSKQIEANGQAVAKIGVESGKRMEYTTCQSSFIR